MKAFDNLNVTQNIKICLSHGKKHCERGENAGDEQFLIFPQYFQGSSF